MFSIVCTLEDSEFTGQIVEVETENDYSFQRTIGVYGHPATEIYPKAAWKRSTDLLVAIPIDEKD